MKNPSRIFRFIMLSCIVLSININAYTQDSTNNKQYEELIKLLKDLSKKDTTQLIGTLKLNNDEITYKHNGIVSNKKIPIDSASILTKDGYIIDLNIYSGNRVFTNRQAPIAITSQRFSKIDNLKNAYNSNESITLRDAIRFTSYTPFIAEDGFFWLTKSNPRLVLERKVGVNTVLDLRLYTDALGLFDTESNGIIQTDARFKQYLHRRNIPNTGIKVAQYVKINFNASKFDTKYSYVDSTRFSRSELLQKSFISTEVSINIANGWIDKKSLSSYYFDLGTGVNLGHLAKSTDTVTIISPFVFLETGLNLKSSDNAGADIYLRYLRQYSPQTDFQNKDNACNFIKVGAEIFWNPFNDKASRIFGRFNYVTSTKKEEKDNHFIQLQFGYSLLLSKIVNK